MQEEDAVPLRDNVTLRTVIGDNGMQILDFKVSGGILYIIQKCNYTKVSRTLTKKNLKRRTFNRRKPNAGRR